MAADERTADVIIIGAGVSGLSAGCLLAESGLDVIVLEQHRIAGGLLQQFSRRGIRFDTGMHYVGGAGPGGPLRPYLRRLGILDRIQLEPFDPDGFDEVILPGRRFTFPVGAHRIARKLTADFPQCAPGIVRFFERLAEIAEEHVLFSLSAETLPRDRRPPALGGSLSDEITRLIPAAPDDLRALLSAHCLLYGVPADRAALSAHALVAGSFFHSTHGIRGGGDALAAALVSRLTELGGELLLRHDVTRIDSEGGVIRGVETSRGAAFRTSRVIATAHPGIVLDLLGEENVRRRVVRRVRSLTNAPSGVLVHGVVRGLATPVTRRNWIRFARAAHAWEPVPDWFEHDLPTPILTILAAPETEGAAGDAVFQVYCPVRVEDLGDTSDRAAWRRRKAAVGQRILREVEDVVPLWKGRTELADVSTPFSLRHFVRSPDGSTYGVENSTEQSRGASLLLGFGIQGLSLSGQSVGLPGVLGAIVSSTLAAFPDYDDLARVYAELRDLSDPC